MDIANSSVFWGITFLAIFVVVTQSLLFLKKSYRAGLEMGIPKETMITAFKTGIISAIGPSVVIVIGMISLLVTVGGPTALMRLAYIGNVVYELMSVGFAADAFGVTRDSITPEVFVTSLWCMSIGCVGWILFIVLFTDKMDIVRNKMVGGKSRMIPVISSAAMLGAYGYFNAGYIISMDLNTVAILVGFFTMIGIIIIYRKTKIKFLNEWGLTFAMFAGMLSTILFN